MFPIPLALPPTKPTDVAKYLQQGAGGGREQERRGSEKEKARSGKTRVHNEMDPEKETILPPLFYEEGRKEGKKEEEEEGFNAQLALTEPERIADRNVDEVSRSRYTS